jgi:NADH-quinone oxidoreductase subunit J
MNLIGFIALSLLAIGSALVVILRRNPIESALALAANLVSIAGFYLLLHAQFIALLQVIVYAGAIMVLILFVIMLLNLPENPDGERRGFFQFWLAIGLAAMFVVVLGGALREFGGGMAFEAAAADFGTVKVLGQELFTRFFYAFEVISLLLIVAMVGAVLLAKRRLR